VKAVQWFKHNHCSNASHNPGTGSSKSSAMEIEIPRNGKREASSRQVSDGIGVRWATGFPLRLMMVSCFIKTSSSRDVRLLRADDTDNDLIHELLRNITYDLPCTTTFCQEKCRMSPPHSLNRIHEGFFDTVEQENTKKKKDQSYYSTIDKIGNVERT
jgi:hypothetical protein